jgi:predicted small lipoprotein YifL
MTRIFRASLLLAAALLAACGQRGDLFIPEPEREPIATVPTGRAATPGAEQ